MDEGDRFAEEGPGQECADEGGGGEDDLAAGGAEIAGAFDPQRDRCAVAERADEQRGGDLADLDLPGGGDGDPEDEVDGAGDGAFVKELQRSLLACKIDCAIHSLKDVPTEPVDGLLIAAVLKRGDPRDALHLHYIDPDAHNHFAGSPKQRNPSQSRKGRQGSQRQHRSSVALSQSLRLCDLA